MLGAIIGDTIGSVYEFASTKTKNFPAFAQGSYLTDDSIMTIAVGCTCAHVDLQDEEEFKYVLIQNMKELGRYYPSVGYGGAFMGWLFSSSQEPYNSYGNGSAMRVSPVAWVAKTLDDAERLARWSAEITHNHPEGIKGAQATAAAIKLALDGHCKCEIRDYIEQSYYSLNFTLAQIRPDYYFDVTCQGTVPQAIVAFLESENYEDAIRNAISLGGDADTLAAITGAIAEAYYGIPGEWKMRVFDFMDERIRWYYHEYADMIYEMNGKQA